MPTASRPLLLLLSLIYLVLPDAGLSQECFDYEPWLGITGSLETSGSASGFAVAGNHVYLADYFGAGLLVIDVSDLTSPSLLTSLPLPGGTSPRLVTVAGNMALVSDRDDWIHLVDISNPLSPTVLGSVALADAVQEIAVVGNLAYVANYTQGVQILDISDPANPSVAASLAVPGSTYGVAVDGGYLFVGGADAGLNIFELSAPLAPVAVASMDTLDHVMAVTVSGDFAYLGNWKTGLQIVDVSDPAAPVALGAAGTPTSAFKVAVSGDLAFVKDGFSNCVAVIDINGGQYPYFVECIETDGSPFHLTVVGDNLYFTDDIGLKIIDLSPPNEEARLGSVGLPARPNDVAVTGEFACVTTQGAGLQVVDFGNPEAPFVAGTLALPDTVRGVTISGNLAYLACSFAGNYDSSLKVVDVSDPQLPSLVGSMNVPFVGYVSAVAVVGDLAYVTSTWWLHVVDISNPTLPVILGSVENTEFTGGNNVDVAVAGGHAFVACVNGMHIVDITLPGAPSLVNTIITPRQAHSIDIAEDVLYLADGTDGLHVYDISNLPSCPRIGLLDSVGYANSVSVQGDFAYLTNDYFGSLVIDISSPASPAIVGPLAMDDEWPTCILAANGYLVRTYTYPGVFQVARLNCGYVSGVRDFPVADSVLHLGRNYPNPFNPRTTISFDLPTEARASLRVYDISGRLVRTLVDDEFAPQGRNEVNWNARDNTGRRVASGVYFYRLEVGDRHQTKRMLLVK